MKQYIKVFDSISAYTTFKSTEDFIKPNVSFCVKENQVFYTPYTSPVNASVGDYLYSDITTGTSTTNGKTIIGVCVIPTGKLPDGKARFISIKAMSCSTPETGTTSADCIYWGGYYDVDTLENFNKVIIKVSGTSTLGTSNYGYLKLNGAYQNNSNNIPSPFTEFSLYKDTSVSEFNALSDFNGALNTAKILAVDDAGYPNWRTNTNINNDSDDEYSHPAARCCYMYHTEGTSKGDWYLPAIGELGFLAENRDVINTKIQAAGGEGLYSANNNEYMYLWSSTECGSGSAYYLNLGIGSVFSSGKDNDSYVFAFLAF